ncbi:hypothetical protein HanIR_Chr05g0238121 [Helianthus annuus]|nr:hypothetical protein HanIR_Chr05g0238121 [Helianthus annuus]
MPIYPPYLTRNPPSILPTASLSQPQLLEFYFPSMNTTNTTPLTHLSCRESYRFRVNQLATESLRTVRLQICFLLVAITGVTHTQRSPFRSVFRFSKP